MNNINTSIHTRIDNTYRISSIWREYSNAFFNSWAWETIVWKRHENGTEKIDFQSNIRNTADQVITLHKQLCDKIISGLPYEEDDE